MTTISTPDLKTLNFTSVTVDGSGRMVKETEGHSQYFIEDLGHVGIDMIAVPAGAFMMGAALNEAGAAPMEGPQHEVRAPGFYMSRFLVTQAQYEAVTGHNPAQVIGPDNPVECVNWYEAMEFCRRLSDRTGRTYRLPTEAEWEYACRAGTTTPFHTGESLTDQLANCYAEIPYASTPPGDHRSGPTPVGMFPPNAFGFHDMSGNLFEWCSDLLHGSYEGAPTDGSSWTEGGWPEYYVLRGASWVNFPSFCRSAFRFGNIPIYRSVAIGFRVVSPIS